MNSSLIYPDDNIKYVIGIDFGHGETSAAYCLIEGDAIPKDIQILPDKTSIPSAICIETTTDGREIRYIGYPAVNNSGRKPSMLFDAYFKDAPTSMSKEQKESIKNFFSEVYQQIIARYSSLFTANNHVVFIACPSNSEKWTEEATNQYLEIALEAGLPIVGASINGHRIEGIIRESRAAYIQLLHDDNVTERSTNSILVIDFGSSTVDITYHGKDSTLIDKSYPYGAEKVELAVINYLKSNPKYKDSIETLHSLYPDAYKKAEFTIRRSKEYFFKGDSYSLEVRLDFQNLTNKKMLDKSISEDIYDDTLEQILAPYINDIEKEVFGNFKNDYLDGRQIGLLVITGGASCMPFVKEKAVEVFADEQTLVIPPKDPSLSVSEGLAAAGRADIKLFKLLKKLFAKTDISTPFIADDVFDTASQKMAESVVSMLNSEYKEFRDNSSGTRTIDSLEKTIKNRIYALSGSFTKDVSSSFSSKLSSYADGTVKVALRDYVSDFFPYFYLNSIGQKPVSTDLCVILSSDDLSAIRQSISTSVSAMEEKNLELAAKILYDLAVGIVDGVTTLGRNLLRGGYNLGRRVLGELDIIDYKKSDDVEYVEFGQICEAIGWNFRDKSTVLDYDKRSKVYDAYYNNRSVSKEQLVKDIKKQLSDKTELKNQINSSCKQYVAKYILSEAQKIRSQLK